MRIKDFSIKISFTYDKYLHVIFSVLFRSTFAKNDEEEEKSETIRNID